MKNKIFFTIIIFIYFNLIAIFLPIVHIELNKGKICSIINRKLNDKLKIKTIGIKIIEKNAYHFLLIDKNNILHDESFDLTGKINPDLEYNIVIQKKTGLVYTIKTIYIEKNDGTIKIYENYFVNYYLNYIIQKIIIDYYYKLKY